MILLFCNSCKSAAYDKSLIVKIDLISFCKTETIVSSFSFPPQMNIP